MRVGENLFLSKIRSDRLEYSTVRLGFIYEFRIGAQDLKWNVHLTFDI
jgi:hypothetical protein